MRRFYVLFSALLVIAFSQGCKSDSDVLATYSDGKITRGEFYKWLDDRHIARETVLSSMAKQKAKLRQMAVERLTVIEAKKAGYDKTDDFRKLEELVRNNFTAGYYRKQIREKGSFEEEAAKVSMIKFRVKDYVIEKNKRKKLTDAELNSEYENKMKEASDLIARLKAGESFAELAKKHSDDYSRKKGGDIGFITRGMREPEFTDAVFKLKSGEYTGEPLRLKTGVYIIKVEKKEKLTPDNIERIIDNEREAKRLKSRLLGDVSRNYENRLKEAADVVNNIDRVNFRDSGALIYKIADREYRVSDLNGLISFIESKRGASGRSGMKLDDDKKRKLSERMFSEELICHDARKNNIDRDGKFMAEMESFRDFTIAGSYKNDVVLSGIKITPAQIREEFDKQNKRLLQKNEKDKKGRKVQKPKSFSEMKDRIEYMLFSRERSVKTRDYENGLISKVSFVINEDKLEEEKKKDDSGTRGEKRPPRPVIKEKEKK